MKWVQKQTGFTIVELLIVVVVIAILASITVVAYNGIQQRAVNAAFLTKVDTYEKAIRLYQTTNGTFPSTMYDPDAAGPQAAAPYMICLGDTYPAAPGFNVGYCTGSEFLDSSDPQASAVMPSVTTNLLTVVKNLPDVSTQAYTFTDGGTLYGLHRGILYQSNGAEAVINFYLPGNQNCGRGSKSVETNLFDKGLTITQCSIIIR